MLRYLLEKEFKQIRRDKFMPKIIFIVPMLQLLILPFAANFEMRNIHLCVIDHDHSTLSVQLTEKILSSHYFQLSRYTDRYEKALNSVESNETDLIVEIPSQFEQSLQREGSSRLFIAANAVNGTKGGMGIVYLNSIIQDFNQEQGFTPAHSIPPITNTLLFNPHLSYKVYMVPGIMAFLLTVICCFLPALNMVSEKEKGTMEQINVTPIPKPLFLLSKLIPFWVIGFVLLTLAIAAGYLFYGLKPAGSIGIIYLFAAIYLIACAGFGLAVASISSTQQQAMLTTFFILVICVLLSGLFTPISSMPEWAQRITLVNPIRYLIEVMRMVYLKGSSLGELQGQFEITCLFAVVFNVLAVFLYRKKV